MGMTGLASELWGLTDPSLGIVRVSGAPGVCWEGVGEEKLNGLGTRDQHDFRIPKLLLPWLLIFWHMENFLAMGAAFRVVRMWDIAGRHGRGLNVPPSSAMQ